MRKNDLIAKQQIEIEILNKRLMWAKQDKNEIVMTLICIGGPLNDNILRYSKEQRGLLHRILEFAELEDHEEI